MRGQSARFAEKDEESRIRTYTAVNDGVVVLQEQLSREGFSQPKQQKDVDIPPDAGEEIMDAPAKQWEKK